LVGEELGISPKTVDFHLQNCRRKLGVPTTLQVIVFFVRQPVNFPSSEVHQLTLPV